MGSWLWLAYLNKAKGQKVPFKTINYYVEEKTFLMFFPFTVKMWYDRVLWSYWSKSLPWGQFPHSFIFHLSVWYHSSINNYITASWTTGSKVKFIRVGVSPLQIYCRVCSYILLIWSCSIYHLLRMNFFTLQGKETSKKDAFTKETYFNSLVL